MSDILLAKPKLPPDWIDTSVGEAHIVRYHFLTTFPDVPNMASNALYRTDQYEYPLPTGYAPLVDLLEKKHGAPVIITNGAKQALGASFYALKKMGKTSVGMRTPYWALIPPLVEVHGLHCEATSPAFKYDAMLSLAPNNPDGFMAPSDLLKTASDLSKDIGVPFIHDGAYYTHVYLPPSHKLELLGDVQIYSISKMLGLSGLRLGYVVCPNATFYQYIQEYMETMTVGVSILPQLFLYNIFLAMEQQPHITRAFEGLSRLSLRDSKEIMQGVDSEILEVPDNLTEIPGMFGWFKVGPACDFAKAKINTIDGALFGGPGFVRMNLAFDTRQMKEIVRRLNSVKA